MSLQISWAGGISYAGCLSASIVAQGLRFRRYGRMADVNDILWVWGVVVAIPFFYLDFSKSGLSFTLLMVDGCDRCEMLDGTCRLAPWRRTLPLFYAYSQF